MLGDNFYNTGVTSVTDQLWTKDYFNLYPLSKPALQVPWYAIVGNHDYYNTLNPAQARVQAQINMTTSALNKYKRWNMPANHYNKVFLFGGASVEIFFIDTVRMAPNGKKYTLTGMPAPVMCNGAVLNDGNGNPITSPDQFSVMLPEYEWLSMALSQSTADYKLVAGHYHGIIISLLCQYIIQLCDKIHIYISLFSLYCY